MANILKVINVEKSNDLNGSQDSEIGLSEISLFQSEFLNIVKSISKELDKLDLSSIPSSQAKYATTSVGDCNIETFMLSDGSYLMSQTDAAEVVGLSKRNLSEFMHSKTFKTLLGKDYTNLLYESKPIEIYSKDKKKFHRVSLVSLEVVVVYWLWQSYQGNEKAMLLCKSLINKTSDAPNALVNEIVDRVITRSEDKELKPLWERLVEIGRKVPDEEWAKLPKDFSRNFEHYMYGAEKEE